MLSGIHTVSCREPGESPTVLGSPSHYASETATLRLSLGAILPPFRIGVLIVDALGLKYKMDGMGRVLPKNEMI